MATILIVDDAEFLRLRISKILTSNGYTVAQADNGLAAVNLYPIAKPDVVLMDVTMPEMDGLTALRELRALDPQARVVILTALGQESVLLESLKLGAVDFMVKPFEAARVLAVINRALGLHLPA